ncbi:MAG: SDR family oxidoreductase [Bacteroidota bacterium]|jgi:short-subunit dehydrogenase|nr:SDR family oxidoreductase [Chitinophagaceae bacterium]MCE2757801.1 SDR family oxidoreductase [Chitinophagaceae bacterium]
MNVVITGASRGIGKTIAEHFAQKGANLFLCSRNMEKTMAWQQSLMKQYQISISSFNADLSNLEEAKSFASHVLHATSQIDILINNTGIYEPGATYNEPEGQLEKMLKVNLLSAYHLTRALIGPMIERKAGHVFNICSIASLKAYPNGGSYSISKWALDGFSKNLREEMKAFNIKVTTVYPGATLTSSWDGMDIDPQRILETDDIAKMIIAASDLSPQACVEDIVIRPQLGDL